MIIIFIETVILAQSNNNGDDQKTYRHTDCQAEDIDDGEQPASEKIPES